MHVQFCDEYVTFCTVGPDTEAYGRVYPIYVFHKDGSWSRENGDNYYRSPAKTLHKKFTEYSLPELKDILKEFDYNLLGKGVSKEFATKIRENILSEMKKRVLPMVEFQPYVVLRALTEYFEGEDEPKGEWTKMLDGLIKCDNIIN
jgi:hypothetical protein